MENEKLNEIKNNLAILPVLEGRAQKLRRSISEAEDNVRSLLLKFQQESLDVEQLKKSSLSSTLLKLTCIGHIFFFTIAEVSAILLINAKYMLL